MCDSTWEASTLRPGSSVVSDAVSPRGCSIWGGRTWLVGMEPPFLIADLFWGNREFGAGGGGGASVNTS